ncbi:28523_t:CDS:1, partial [Racocetra persica]
AAPRPPICVHADLVNSNPLTINDLYSKQFYGFISSCETPDGSTFVKGMFFNMPDNNQENYYFYLLYPDNSMRHDLTALFSKALTFKGNQAELNLYLQPYDFPLRGFDNYAEGWIVVYYFHDSIVTAAGPARLHLNKKSFLHYHL